MTYPISLLLNKSVNLIEYHSTLSHHWIPNHVKTSLTIWRSERFPVALAGLRGVELRVWVAGLVKRAVAAQAGGPAPASQQQAGQRGQQRSQPAAQQRGCQARSPQRALTAAAARRFDALCAHTAGLGRYLLCFAQAL